MTALILKRLVSKILLLLAGVMAALYLFFHPLGKPIIRQQLPPIQVLDFPSISLEEESFSLPSQALRNPFLPLLSPQEKKAKTHPEQPQANHTLSMVLIGKERSCILDGRVVKEGEEVTKGLKVLKITPKGVWIEENGRETFISIEPYH